MPFKEQGIPHENFPPWRELAELSHCREYAQLHKVGPVHPRITLRDEPGEVAERLGKSLLETLRGDTRKIPVRNLLEREGFPDPVERAAVGEAESPLIIVSADFRRQEKRRGENRKVSIVHHLHLLEDAAPLGGGCGPEHASAEPLVDVQKDEKRSLDATFLVHEHGRFLIRREGQGSRGGELDLPKSMRQAEMLENGLHFKGLKAETRIIQDELFRHGFILCNRDGNIERPEQLNGKRLGFLRWVQTAAIWMRGTLVDDYGVSPEKTQWYVASIHHWDHAGDEGEIRPRSGFQIRRLKNYAGAHAAQETAFSALRQGEIDALGTTHHPRLLLPKDKKIKRLFENYKEVEAGYYKRTRILPIMHVIAVRNSAVEKDPDLPGKVFELFSQAKKLGRESVVWNSSLYVAWKDHYLDEEGELFQGDPFAYGLAANAHVIEKFLSYCWDQGIMERRLNPKDLFDPSTWDLRET